MTVASELLDAAGYLRYSASRRTGREQPMKMIHTIILPLSLFVLLESAAPSDSGSGAPFGKIIAASFSSSLSGQDDNVRRNIMLAAGKLNGVIISSGAVFSFNDTVGEGSSRNGFLPGRVLYRDRVAMEPGGGLCQVSSTLFNALLMAGCVIIERHRHGQPVSYVPLGLDATIKFGKKDLRIKNPHSYGLKIEMSASDASLLVRIITDQKPAFKYEICTEEDELALPAADDAERIRQGISVLVYRKKYRGDTLLENALLYKDYYPPVYTR
jgi:vancomycin resistance protein VanW